MGINEMSNWPTWPLFVVRAIKGQFQYKSVARKEKNTSSI